MTIPERIGKYTISEVLGKGSMGTVYKGFDPHIQRPVAIKVIHKELLGDSSALDSVAARFRNEAKAVGRILHPGVVAIHEFGEDESTAYIAMEFVQGRSLEDVIASATLLPQALVLRIMEQLLDALQFAHAQGVWHRDVKPANLILTSTGQVKLTDFGIARIADANLTQVSSAIGTPSYMAPEQFRGTGVDHRADVFASGVVLYRLLTGKRPFAGSADVVMYKILNEDPPPPSGVTQGARPAAFDAVVARAIAKNIDQRYQSAAEMQRALRAIADAPDHDATNIMATAPQAAERDGAGATRGSGFGAAPAPGVATSTPAPGVTGGTGVVPSAGTAIGASATGVVPAGWDAMELSRIERALASHVGPMARLMVRDAARSCFDSGSLVVAVARHIPEQAKRQQFLDVAQAGSQARALASSVLPAANRTGQGDVEPAQFAAPADPLTDDFRARALLLVTRKIGPIAKIMVKRAADQCGGDRARFVQLLLDGVSDADRTGLQRDLAN